jgi:isochorismate hydrolase
VKSAEWLAKRSKKHWKTFDLSKAALLVIDMQHYFTNPASHAFVPSAPFVQKNIQKLITRFKKEKRPVIYTFFAVAPKEKDPILNWWGHTVATGSKEAQLTLTPDATDLVLRKSTYSAFHKTALHDFLQVNAVESVFITGLLSNLCCETTARAAFDHGYDVFFGLDSTAAYDEDQHLATLLNLSQGFATPIATDDL